MEGMKGRDKADHIDDERTIGNGVIVTLKTHFKFSGDDHGLHVKGFDNMREVNTALKYAHYCPCKKCE